MTPDRDGEYITEPARTLNRILALSLTWRVSGDNLVRACGYGIRNAIREMEIEDMSTHLTHDIGNRGLETLAMADKIAAEQDAATDRDDRRMVAARGGRHRYTDGMFFTGHCDLCGLSKEVHK